MDVPEGVTEENAISPTSSRAEGQVSRADCFGSVTEGVVTASTIF